MAVACDKCGARELPQNTHPRKLTRLGIGGSHTITFMCKAHSPSKHAAWIMTTDKKDEKTDASAGTDGGAGASATAAASAAAASAAEEDVSEDEGTWQKRFDGLIAVRNAAKKNHTKKYEAFLQSARSASEDPHVPFPDDAAQVFACVALAYEDAQAAVENEVDKRHARRIAQTAAQVAAQTAAESTALPRSKKRARTAEALHSAASAAPPCAEPCYTCEKECETKADCKDAEWFGLCASHRPMELLPMDLNNPMLLLNCAFRVDASCKPVDYTLKYPPRASGKEVRELFDAHHPPHQSDVDGVVAGMSLQDRNFFSRHMKAHGRQLAAGQWQA